MHEMRFLTNFLLPFPTIITVAAASCHDRFFLIYCLLIDLPSLRTRSEDLLPSLVYYPLSHFFPPTTNSVDFTPDSSNTVLYDHFRGQ